MYQIRLKCYQTALDLRFLTQNTNYFRGDSVSRPIFVQFLLGGRFSETPLPAGRWLL